MTTIELQEQFFALYSQYLVERAKSDKWFKRHKQQAEKSQAIYEEMAKVKRAAESAAGLTGGVGFNG